MLARDLGLARNTVAEAYGQLAAEGLLDELCLTISPLLEGGHSTARVTSRQDQPELTGMRLVALLEDEGFLLSRYVRA